MIHWGAMILTSEGFSLESSTGYSAWLRSALIPIVTGKRGGGGGAKRSLDLGFAREGIPSSVGRATA